MSGYILTFIDYFVLFLRDTMLVFYKTRTKTSIRYAKENDRDKRERKVEGEI